MKLSRLLLITLLAGNAAIFCMQDDEQPVVEDIPEDKVPESSDTTFAQKFAKLDSENQIQSWHCLKAHHHLSKQHAKTNNLPNIDPLVVAKTWTDLAIRDTQFEADSPERILLEQHGIYLAPAKNDDVPITSFTDQRVLAQFGPTYAQKVQEILIILGKAEQDSEAQDNPLKETAIVQLTLHLIKKHCQNLVKKQQPLLAAIKNNPSVVHTRMKEKKFKTKKLKEQQELDELKSLLLLLPSDIWDHTQIVPVPL